MAWVGVAGLAAGLALLVVVPSMKAISRVLLLFAGFHVAGLLVMLASGYVLGGNRIAARLRVSKRREGFDFGWAPGFTYGPWIAAVVLGAIAVALEVAAPGCWPLAMAATLQGASFFAGGLLARGAGRYDEAFLPMVNLVDRPEGVVLDAGCGAGRTTIALARAQKKVRVVAVDRFDASYIEGGGLGLLKENLAKAGLTERVQIERSDLTALPFEEDHFDGGVSAHAMDHLGAETERGLREILRVMKPGARFLLVVSVPGWPMFSIANVISFQLKPRAAWGELLKGCGFRICDQGMFNGSWFAVLRKPETHDE